MRTLALSMIIVLVALPAAARPRKHARKHTATAAAHVVPNDRAAQEHARAEAELSDLRAGRVSDEPAAAAEPAQVWAVQDNDAEVPANLRRK